MKLIHTADWHLGQTFFEYERKNEHIRFLIWLRSKIKNNEVDLLVIAGDIFDNANPSADSQKLYYNFLRDVTAENPELQVIVIAGNHDSAARLEAPNALLDAMNITVRGTIPRNADGDIDFQHLIVPVKTGGVCLAVPYLRHGDCPDAESYAQGVKKMYETLVETGRALSLQKPIIALGHLQATGAEISENDRFERTIMGGLEAISLTAFSAEIDYVALGHLHRAQRVSGRENVRYAGAPIPMSFAEKNNKQSVTLVEITDEVTINLLHYEDVVKLLSIPNVPKPMEDVLAELSKLPDGALTEFSPFLEVKVLITEPEPSMRHQIEEVLKTKAVRLARLAAVTPTREGQREEVVYQELQNINPFEMAMNIFERKFGATMPDTMKEMLNTVIQNVEK